jgi:acyl carrier protein
MITEQDVRAAIGRVVENIDANSLPIGANFVDAGLDSLDQASILLDIQENNGIEFPEDASELTSIQAILQFAESNRA